MQHNINATHRGKRNIYMFTWESKRNAIKPIPPPPKPSKEEKQKFLCICNLGEFLVESSETTVCFVVKEEVGQPIEVQSK